MIIAVFLEDFNFSFLGLHDDYFSVFSVLSNPCENIINSFKTRNDNNNKIVIQWRNFKYFIKSRILLTHNFQS